MRRDDEDDRSGGTGGASWVDRIVIPDDISELDAEVRALRRERRVRRRRERLRRLTGSGRAGSLLLVVLLLIAGVTGLLVMLQPRRPGGSVQAERRLPDVMVRLVDGTSRRIRDLRPAVFALAPNGCHCDEQLVTAGTAAHGYNLSFYLVDRSLPALPPGLGPASATRLVEPRGLVAERYAAEKNGRRATGGLVLVLVSAGGDVVTVLPGAPARTVERELSELAPEAAPAS